LLSFHCFRWVFRLELQFLLELGEDALKLLLGKGRLLLVHEWLVNPLSPYQEDLLVVNLVLSVVNLLVSEDVGSLALWNS